MMDKVWEKIMAKHELMKADADKECCFDKAWDKIMLKQEAMLKDAKAKRGREQEEEEEEEEEEESSDADAQIYLTGRVASFGSDRESWKQKELQPNHQQPFSEQMLWLSVAICADLIRLAMYVDQSATLPEAGFPHAVCLVC